MPNRRPSEDRSRVLERIEPGCRSRGRHPNLDPYDARCHLRQVEDWLEHGSEPWTRSEVEACDVWKKINQGSVSPTNCRKIPKVFEA